MLIDSTKITLNNNGNVGIGVLPNINNFVSVNGDLALKEIAAATAPSGYGKIYVNSTNSEFCYDADDQSAVCLTNNGQVAGSGGGGGGGASPAGSNGSVQFRQNSTTMGADANNLHWDDTNNRLGIITNSPLTTLHLNGSLALYPRNDTVIQASNGIVASKLTNSVLYIRGECMGGIVDIVPNTQIAPGYPGQLLTLVGMYEAEGVKFDTTISFKLDGNTSFTLGENDTLTLIYAPGGWIEVSRSDNPGLGIPCP
jgi:hypothetical protein